LLLGIVAVYKTAGSLFEAIAFTAELDEHAAMHETIEDGGGQCGVTEYLSQSAMMRFEVMRVLRVSL
jgi:hypothetical protein